MHAEVVAAIDAHLTEMQRLRRQLTEARAIEPGERLDVVLEITASAEQLAHVVNCHRPTAVAIAAASS